MRVVFPKVFGRADEYNYICKKCGKKFYSRDFGEKECPNGGQHYLFEI